MTEPLAAPEPALLTLIARELAQEQFTLEQILQRYDLDQDYYDQRIAPNAFFQRVLADYTKEWHSIGSTHKRLAFAAAAALEENLPVLANRMGSRQSELADAVATAKLFRELAGIAAPVGGPSAQSGTPFSISINFGNNKIALEARPSAPLELEASGIRDGEITEIPSEQPGLPRKAHAKVLPGSPGVLRSDVTEVQAESPGAAPGVEPEVPPKAEDEIA